MHGSFQVGASPNISSRASRRVLPTRTSMLSGPRCEATITARTVSFANPNPESAVFAGGDALRSGTIAGAGLDVYADEPRVPEALLSMEQVIVTPHALCWTDECFDAIAREGLTCLVDFAAGRTPRSVVPPA